MNSIILNFESATMTYPITEDFQIETSTEFSSFGDLCPTISSLVDVGNMLTTTGNGVVTDTGLNLRSILDAPRWTKTNPVKITVDMFFYTKEKAKEDVVDAINILIGSHVLSQDDKGKTRVPGINASNVKSIDEMQAEITANGGEALSKTEKDNINTQLQKQKNSMFSVLIPGVVFLPYAFIFSISPTYSKHVTENGYPLWASANVQIQSVMPAFVEYFKMGRLFDTQGKEKFFVNTSNIPI